MIFETSIRSVCCFVAFGSLLLMGRISMEYSDLPSMCVWVRWLKLKFLLPPLMLLLLLLVSKQSRKVHSFPLTCTHQSHSTNHTENTLFDISMYRISGDGNKTLCLPSIRAVYECCCCCCCSPVHSTLVFHSAVRVISKLAALLLLYYFSILLFNSTLSRS